MAACAGSMHFDAILICQSIINIQESLFCVSTLSYFLYTVHSRYFPAPFTPKNSEETPHSSPAMARYRCLLWVHNPNKVLAFFHIVFHIVLYSTAIYYEFININNFNLVYVMSSAATSAAARGNSMNIHIVWCAFVVIMACEIFWNIYPYYSWYPSTNWVALKDMGEVHQHQNKTTHSKTWTVCMLCEL